MSKLIVFKTHSFPNISETFIVSNIVVSISKGYSVAIIVDKLNTKANTSQPNLLEKFSLLDKVFRFIQPKGQKNRNFKAIRYLFNPVLFYYFIKYSFYKGKKSLDYIFILKFYLKYRKARAYHVHFATAIKPLFELKEIGFLKSRIIVTFHGWDAHYLPEGNDLKKMISDFNKHIFKITTNSSYLKSSLVERGFPNDLINLVPIGIDIDFFKPIKKDTTNTIKVFKIITVGRLVSLKGQDLGIRAIKYLKEKGHKIKYTIVGSGQEYSNLQKLIFELNLENEVDLLGEKNQIEIKELLGQHHLFLMTSINDEDNRREAFGLVTLEAQSMGLPVVAFDSGGVKETILEGVTGFAVLERDINSLVLQIEKIILDDKLLKSMKKEAISHIQRTFSLRKTNEKYINLYK